MASASLALRILDDSPASRALDLASELFHRINRIIPPDQQVLTIAPKTSVRDAVSLMKQNGYSQIPVVLRGTVLGVFSYRSFAQGSAEASLETWIQQKCAPGDLTVDEFMEDFEFARVSQEMEKVFDAIDRDNGILIGTPERLIGILTPMDFLRYLHKVASPFVMVSEIELALRALIHMALDAVELEAVAKRCLAGAYRGEDRVPTTLEEMSFDNYQTLVANGQTWDRFEPILGGTRVRAAAKLKEVGAIRNDLFHFRRELNPQEHGVLTSHRKWLLTSVQQRDLTRQLGGEA